MKLKDPTPDVPVTRWDGELREGPGAATAAIPIIQVDGHGGHTLEPGYKRMPIGPDHILYPVMIGLALFPILMGSAGHHLADDMPEEDTHPFFPDHFWPYPIIAVIMMLTVGVLSAFVQTNMQLEQSADPRAVVLPRLKKEAERKGGTFAAHFVAFDVAAGVFDGVKKKGATVVAAANEAQLNSQLQFILQRKILLEDEEAPPAKAKEVK